MNLIEKIVSGFPFGKKEEVIEYYFALNIGLSEVTALVWGIIHHKLEIIGQATLPYQDEEDLLKKAEITLDQALDGFEAEPKKILFGVPESWGIEESLKEPYLKFLRRMVKTYELEPLAYVTTSLAISHLLEKQEGVPSTALLLGLGDFTEVVLLRGGKVIEAKAIKREGRLFEDIEKALAHFTEVEVLPSKVLIYPTKEGEDIKKLRDDLMSYPWMSKLPFLHFPKIEILNENFASLAVTAGGAVELDPGVDLKNLFNNTRVVMPPHAKANKYTDEYSEELVKKEEDLGFVKGDVKKALNEEEVLEDDNLAVPDLEKFTGNKRIPLKRETPLSGNPHHQENFLPSGFSVKILDKLSLLSGKLPGPIKSLRKIGGGKVLFGVGVILLFLIAYLVLVKAVVTVYVEPRILEEETQIIADPKSSTFDESAKIIPAIVLETTVTGSDKGEATGQKQIGNPAKGKAVLYNLSENKVALSQGTILTSSSGLKFILDTSVQIASQSSSIGSDFTTVIKPGKSDPLGITASEIGPESNLAAGTDLTVAGYNKNQVIARVEEALSGGTSKNVTVVTSDDQKKLQVKLTDILRQKALEELKKEISSEKKIVAEALTIIDGRYNFNKQVNDQAVEFSLNATIRFKGTAYSDTDLRTLVGKMVSIDIPAGFELNLQEMETLADVSKVEKDGRLIFIAKFRAKLMPKLDSSQLKKELRGKSISEVEKYLKSLDNVLGSEVRMMPNLPDNLARIPLWDKNISVIISPK